MQSLSIQDLIDKFTKQELLNQNKIMIIDVRSPSEFQHEHIIGAKNIPLEDLNKLKAEEIQGKTILFHCQSGNRTSINESLLDNTPYSDKFCLSGGINAWKAANLPTQKNTRAPVDVMRQVQFIVSMMILFGVGLSYLVSPYFILITIFAGIGLLIASTTGFCGMAILLKHMPWNKYKA